MQPFTSLTNIKVWLGLTNATDDALLTRMITMASQYLIGWLNRDIALADYADTLDGNGSQHLIIGNYPIISTASLIIDGNAIPARVGNGNGYIFNNCRIDLVGYLFCTGVGNVQINYTAGYQTSETRTVPTTAPRTITTWQLWTKNVQVTQDGVVIPLIANSTVSTIGYSVVNGVYTFRSSHAGKTVVITYGYIPSDIEQACIELIARKYRERDRIGMVSKSLAGETTAYTQSDLSADMKTMLNQYRRFTPL